MQNKTTAKYIILGDSQVTAFVQGIKDKGRSDLLAGASLGAGSRFSAPFFSVDDGVLKLDEDATLARLWFQRVGVDDLENCRGQLIVSMGLSSFRFCNDKVWRTFGEGRRFLSDTLIDTMIHDQQKYVLEFYKQLTERKLIRAALLGPPPTEDIALLKLMSKARLFDLARRFQQPVINYLEDSGVKIIELPLARKDGFLKSQYHSSHQGHASNFGSLAVTALEEL